MPIAKIEMVVGRIVQESGGFAFYEIKNPSEGFGVFVPGRTCRDVQADDTLSILCVPDDTMSLATYVLVVAAKKGNTTEVLFSRGEHWTTMWRH